MSDRNKAILEEANAAIVEGNNEGFLSFCDDDTKWTFVGDKTLEGKEAVCQWMAITYVEPPKFRVAILNAAQSWTFQKQMKMLSSNVPSVVKSKPPNRAEYNSIAEGDFVTALGDITMKNEGGSLLVLRCLALSRR